MQLVFPSSPNPVFAPGSRRRIAPSSVFPSGSLFVSTPTSMVRPTPGSMAVGSGGLGASSGGGSGGASGRRPKPSRPIEGEDLYVQAFLRDVSDLLTQKRNTQRAGGTDVVQRTATIEQQLKQRITEAVQDYRYLVNRALFQMWTHARYDEFMRETGHEQAISHLITNVFNPEQFSGTGPIRLLDASCGTGMPLELVLQTLGEPMWNRVFIQANDLSPEMLKIAQDRLTALLGTERAARMITWTTSNIVHRHSGAMFPPDSFDIILLSQTLPFLSPTGRIDAFRNMRDAAKQGASLVLVDEFPPMMSGPNEHAAGENDEIAQIVQLLFTAMVEPVRSALTSAAGFRTFLETSLPAMVFKMELAYAINEEHTQNGTQMHGMVFQVDRSRA